jgi:hypothetical protein
VIDWSQVTVGVAALLVMYALLRFAIGALIKSLTAPLLQLVDKVETVDARTVRIEAKLDALPRPRPPRGELELVRE